MGVSVWPLASHWCRNGEVLGWKRTHKRTRVCPQVKGCSNPCIIIIYYSSWLCNRKKKLLIRNVFLSSTQDILFTRRAAHVGPCGSAVFAWGHNVHTSSRRWWGILLVYSESAFVGVYTVNKSLIKSLLKVYFNILAFSEIPTPAEQMPKKTWSRRSWLFCLFVMMASDIFSLWSLKKSRRSVYFAGHFLNIWKGGKKYTAD